MTWSAPGHLDCTPTVEAERYREKTTNKENDTKHDKSIMAWHTSGRAILAYRTLA